MSYDIIMIGAFDHDSNKKLRRLLVLKLPLKMFDMQRYMSASKSS